MKIDNKKILVVFTLLILIALPFIRTLSLYLVITGLMEEYDFINPAIILYASVPFLLYVYISDIKIKKRKLDIFDYLFYILIITSIISTIFSIDKSIAIFGKYYRHEGLLSILSYYLLFINWKVNGTKKDIKNIIKLIVIISIVNSIYALFWKFNSNCYWYVKLCYINE